MTTAIAVRPLDHVLHAGGARSGVDVHDLAICDVCFLDRLIVKGPNAVAFLTGQGIAVPEQLFEVSAIDGGGIVARTGTREVFVEDGVDGTYPRPLPEGKGVDGGMVKSIASTLGYGVDGAYRSPAPAASMLLSGARAFDVLRETCNVDFQQPGVDLVMTRIAGVSCSVLSRKFDGVDAFQIWFDGTFGHYLGSTLLEIVREHNGDVAGISQYFASTSGA